LHDKCLLATLEVKPEEWSGERERSSKTETY
jgi:hypothetical protein